MGQSVCWLAIEARRVEDVRARLGLEPAEATADPDVAPLVGAALSSGWYVVVARGCDHPLLSPAALRAASEGGLAVACSIEEHVMFSSASGWDRGAERWRVAHAAEEGPRHLASTGAPPATLAGLRERYAKLQDAEDAGEGEVDLTFEVPLALARGIAGFKHDEWTDEDVPGGFRALRLTGAGPLGVTAEGRPRPWWRFW